MKPGSLWYDAWLELRGRVIFWLSAVILVIAVRGRLPGLFTGLGPNERLQPAAVQEGAGRRRGVRLRHPRLRLLVADRARHPRLHRDRHHGDGLRTALSIVLGLLAGYYGGWLDVVISRLTDVFFGIPFVLGATVILIAFPRHGIWAMTLALVVLGWTTMTRLMRAQVIAVRDMDFVAAARMLGASDRRIMFKHILPNAIAPVFVVAMLNVGNVIAGEATLDYLGVGLQYPEVSWGLQLNLAQVLFAEHPHLLVFPSLFLTATVLSFLLLGDVVRDALDPKLR